MTERSAARSKRSDSIKSARKSTVGSADQADTEIVRLTRELEAARQRIAELEQRTADALNRIDWVLDSLHNLQSDKADKTDK